jgi:hypothetical protein
VSINHSLLKYGRENGGGVKGEQTFALGIASTHPELATGFADHTHTDGLVSEAFGLFLGLAEDHSVLEFRELGLGMGFLLGSCSTKEEGNGRRKSGKKEDEEGDKERRQTRSAEA